MKLKENIKKYRLERGYSQQKLAELMGYKGKSMISRIEKGDVNLSMSKVIEFSKVLGVKPNVLMGDDEEPPTEENSFANDVGKLVMYYKNKRGMTSKELADTIGIPLAQLLRIENGTEEIFELDMLKKFSDALHVEPSRLINDSLVENIGKNMKVVRELSYVSVDMFCKECGISLDRYQELENGSDPSFDEIARFITFYHMPAQWLINFDFSQMQGDNRLRVAFHIMAHKENLTDEELQQIINFTNFTLRK